MESNIHLSNSDHELVLDKCGANTNTNTTVNNTNRSVLLKHTTSLPSEEDSNIDFNQQNNQYHEQFQRDRPQSLRPRMVTRSSYSSKSSDYIPLLHSDKSLVTTPPPPTTTTTTTTTIATTITNIPIDNNMDSQLLSSSISPEFMGNTSKDTHIDDLLLTNKKFNRTIKYLDNTKLIRRESKSYSTTISPIPLISYHQNVLPNHMDLYPMMMDRYNTNNNNSSSTIIDKKFPNNNNDNDN
ncbi:uncharacterized protein DC041_0000903, partial [Schistosoma bovis]